MSHYDPPWRPIPGSGQNVAIGATSVPSTAFGSQTYAVRLNPTGNCHVEFGQSPVATAASMLLKGTDIGAVFAVTPGQKLAVIQDGSSTGNLNVVELTK